jgi:hypothetical protein
MKAETAYAYSYRHDGGDYIGCRANGRKYYDCYTYEWHEVDCTKCKFITDRKED